MIQQSRYKEPSENIQADSSSNVSNTKCAELLHKFKNNGSYIDSDKILKMLFIIEEMKLALSSNST